MAGVQPHWQADGVCLAASGTAATLPLAVSEPESRYFTSPSTIVVALLSSQRIDFPPSLVVPAPQSILPYCTRRRLGAEDGCTRVALGLKKRCRSPCGRDGGVLVRDSPTPILHLPMSSKPRGKKAGLESASARVVHIPEKGAPDIVGSPGELYVGPWVDCPLGAQFLVCDGSRHWHSLAVMPCL